MQIIFLRDIRDLSFIALSRVNLALSVYDLSSLFRLGLQYARYCFRCKIRTTNEGYAKPGGNCNNIVRHWSELKVSFLSSFRNQTFYTLIIAIQQANIAMIV